MELLVSFLRNEADVAEGDIVMRGYLSDVNMIVLYFL
jgi:hypothetical protein